MVHNAVVNIMTMSESRRGKKERKGISEKIEKFFGAQRKFFLRSVAVRIQSKSG